MLPFPMWKTSGAFTRKPLFGRMSTRSGVTHKNRICTNSGICVSLRSSTFPRCQRARHKLSSTLPTWDSVSGSRARVKAREQRRMLRERLRRAYGSGPPTRNRCTASFALPSKANRAGSAFMWMRPACNGSG